MCHQGRPDGQPVIDTGPPTPNGTVVGLTFCCHCPDVLNHILTMEPYVFILFHFSLCSFSC